MSKSFKLMVSDLLQFSHFKEAKVVAGSAGLSRLVRWVHVLEISEIRKLVSGNEVILSTGVGWSKTVKEACGFLDQLIKKKVSGLCVELGTSLVTIPNEMKDLANQHDFPLLVFPHEVRFIDITHYVNSLLMETQHKMMSDLEAYSNKLNHLLLSSGAFNGILRLCHDYINAQVIYKPLQGNLVSYPMIKENSLIKKIEHTDATHLSELGIDHDTLHQPIQALGYKFGDLIVLGNFEWTEYDSLLLDRTATALAQDQLRTLYVEEKRKLKENQWILNWLKGDYREEEIENYLLDAAPSVINHGFVVCLCKIANKKKDFDITYYSMIFSSLFEKCGFYSLISSDRNTIIFILVNQRQKQDWKMRCQDAIIQMRQTEVFNQRACQIRFSVGRLFDQLVDLNKSYKTAEETLHIQEKDFREKSNLSSPLFYEDLYVHRLLLKIDRESLKEFVNDYIGDLLDYDKKNKDNLLETLKVLLEVNGSKKVAAERLHVVRQTLYHRMDRLKELLGDPFRDKERRLAIELAVHALALLNNKM